MCVAGNRSLLSITTLLGQLTSHELQVIELIIMADNTEDLRALDSECGVRDVHPVRYDDLQALDWTTLEQTAATGGLPCLQMVTVEGSGCHLMFTSHMRALYPTLAQMLHLRAAA